MRRLIATVLARAGFSVSEAESVATARELIGLGFDAAVLDVALPDGEGFDILAQLRQTTPPTASVIVTGRTDERTIARSIGVGVSEFLPKPYRNEDLLQAVDNALALTEVYRDRGRAARAGVRSSARAVEERGGGRLGTAEAGPVAREMANEAGLTERERQTLELVLLGASNPQIATQLDISTNTVKYHVKNMLTKLGLESRSDLLRHIVERGA